MGKDDEEQPAKSFKVQDRRRFVNPESDEGTDERSTHDPSPSRTTESAAPAGGFTSAPAAGEFEARAAGDEAEPAELAEMTFSTFVMGLTTQALMHLGEIADPVRGENTRDLPAAKQMIDLLGILRDKTKGNLDATEEQLLGSMLYDLRMRYVEVSRHS
jgi:hypothetical protein